MTISTPFELFQPVRVPDLDVRGIIVSIWVVSTGVQYEVRYFVGGDLKKEFLLESEIEAVR